MSPEDDVLRNAIKCSSLEEANRYIYPNLTNETTANGVATPLGKPYPFFVPSTVKSTLGSPVSLQFLFLETILTGIIDSLGNWSFCDDVDDALIVVDGMARSHHHERLHRQLLLRY